MNRSAEILHRLNELKLPYTLYEHEPKETIEACQSIEGVDWRISAMFKNVFLCNRQQTQYYLMLLRHDRPFRTAVVSRLLGVSRLSFAPQEKLPEMLSLDPGAVNPLSLMFDPEGRIRLVLDSDLMTHEILLFHPGVNFKSVALKRDDFLRIFLPAIRHEPIILTLPEQ